jgi:hypothetical protein
VSEAESKQAREVSMDVAGWLVLLVALVAGTAALADRRQMSAPLLLAIVGLAGSYIPLSRT